MSCYLHVYKEMFAHFWSFILCIFAQVVFFAFVKSLRVAQFSLSSNISCELKMKQYRNSKLQSLHLKDNGS